MKKQLLAFEVMTAVKTTYPGSGLRDSEFAKALSEKLKAEVSPARVRQARLTLGIPSNGTEGKLPKALELIQRLLVTVGDAHDAVRQEAVDFLKENGK